MMGRLYEKPPVDLTVAQWSLGLPLPQEGDVNLWKAMFLSLPPSPHLNWPLTFHFYFSLKMNPTAILQAYISGALY